MESLDAQARGLGSLELLALHRQLVAIPSVSHAESALLEFCVAWLLEKGLTVEVLGRNLLARAGRGGGPRLLLNTHLDTVPPGSGWTCDPFQPKRCEGAVMGLGSNDAKASMAAMMAALAPLAAAPLAGEVLLTLVCDEETGGEGTEFILPELRRRHLWPDGVLVGEPTGLDVVIAQKGLLVLELTERGQPCHSAHARALGVSNPILALATDLLKLEACCLCPPHPLLGAATLEPTVIQAGQARNQVPGEARAILDIRSVPGTSHEALLARLEQELSGTLTVLSKRLRPRACAAREGLVQAALRARPESRLVGSATMSDLCFFDDVPAIKCGPGQSQRSHTAHEYVLESEILEGAAFYSRLIAAFFQASGGGAAK